MTQHDPFEGVSPGAANNGVTVLGSSGDYGSANFRKQSLRRHLHEGSDPVPDRRVAGL
jgi:hypothetical protein